MFIFQLQLAAMVDMDKHACHSLADESYKKKLWPESYITWDFLEAHPQAMEPGYLQINWDTIPGCTTKSSISGL